MPVRNNNTGDMENMRKKESTVNLLVDAFLSFHSEVDGKTGPDLLKAVRENNLSQIRDLQRNGSESLESTLEAIVQEDNESLLESLVSDLEVENGEIVSEGNSVPIMKYAIEKSSLKCVRVFLDMGIKLAESETSLMREAIKNGDLSFLEYLIESNPAVIRETKEADGKSALHIAAEFGKVGMVKLLLGGMMKVDHVDKNGNTALHLCASSSQKGAAECMRLLIAKGAKIEARNKDGLSPLHKAAFERKRENANFLISRNAQLSSKDNQANSVIQTLSKKVPQSMEEFNKRLDSGIAMEKDECNRDASINLDFTKLLKFSEDTNDMTLFLELVNSPFKDYVEHPLCHAFLHLKFYQVKWFFIMIVVASHLIFSVVYSIYCGLLFGLLCAPGENTSPIKRWDWLDDIQCTMSDNLHTVNLAFAAWMFLILFVVFYTLREIIKIASDQKAYFMTWDAYRNIFIIVSVFLLCHQGHPLEQNIHLYRWQFHVASVTCLLLWVEMMFLIGKLPRFGKHVQMFRSVTWKMFEFSVAYVCLAIGFMMAFMILFSSEEPFTQFPGSFVSVLVMMLGEINYQDLYYPKKQFLNITSGKIEEKVEAQQFPGTAQMIIIAFILVFSLVIMNLLVGLAVSDINALYKTGKRDQLIAQIELINYVESACSSKMFKFLPTRIQDLFKNKVLHLGDKSGMTVPVRYSDITDKSFPEGLKNILHQHCLRKELEERQKDQRKELSDIKAQLEEVRKLISALHLNKEFLASSTETES